MKLMEYPIQDSIHKNRFSSYEIYEKLFEKKHYDALLRLFPGLAKMYKRIVYIAVNFPAMISKLSADMLFEEFPVIRLNNGDNEWLKQLFIHRDFKAQCYESAIENSYRGDAIFRIRAEDGECYIEDINPCCWWPELNPSNTRQEPKAHNLLFPYTVGNSENARKAVHQERHLKGRIENYAYLLDDSGKVEREIDVKTLNMEPVIETNVDNFLVVHVPNFRTNSSYTGKSDYIDLTDIVYSLNNRISRINHTLDTHGDPILLGPKGIIKKLKAMSGDGEVSKQDLGILETDLEKGGEPKYLTWDSKLEVAREFITNLIEIFYVLSETNAAAFGLDKASGVDSGKALFYKLLRTVAKKHRKQMYYDPKLKSLLYTAQLFCKNNDLAIQGYKLKGEPVMPDIVWQDGVLTDMKELIDQEIAKIDADLQTKEEALQNIENITPDEAKEKLARINKEKKENIPQFTANPKFQIDPNADTNADPNAKPDPKTPNNSAQ